MRLKFTKMHGAGNDFVVLDATAAPLALSPAQLRHLGDRRFGVGADQILVVERPTPDAGEAVDFRYRIFNGATGDEVEQCGNGSRCFVRYVHDHGLSQRNPLRVQTVNTQLELRAQPDGRVTVNMNQPVFEHARLPFDASALVPRLENGFELWPLALADGVSAEVAVLSTLYAGLVSAAVYRDLGWRRLHDAVVHAGLATGVVLLVIMASSAIGWLLTFDQMPSGIAHWVQTHVQTPWLVIVLMNLLMLFVGMFIDLPAAVLLLTPVFVPLAQSIGMDMTQLGIMMVVNLALGLYTPPVGTTLFITSSLAGVKVGQTVRELIPFYLVALAVLALVSYVPASILR